MSAVNTGLGAAVKGQGEPGPYTQENGFRGYNEICEGLLGTGWTITDLTNNIAKVAVRADQWIGYDDKETVKGRTEYAEKRNLAGVMFWSIDTDDFKGHCGGGIFPLLRAANDHYGNDMSQPALKKSNIEL